MSFGESIATCFRKYATFQGRASRPEFWWFYLFGFLAVLASLIVDVALHTFLIQLVVSLGLFAPQIGVTVRRLHDTGRSGWWYWIVVIPIVGAIALLVFLCQQSKPAGDRYDDAAYA